MTENTGQAGTLESSDIIITVTKGKPGQGVSIFLTSIVLPQYGPMIEETMRDAAHELGLADLEITAADKGALACTIEARFKTALLRAGLITEQEAIS